MYTKLINLICCFILMCTLSPQSFAQPALITSKADDPIYGDYGCAIREKKARNDGLHHIDTPKLIEKLKNLNVNTYYYLIWHSASDWNDFKDEFLPAAKKAGIQVWAYLVPPSELRSESDIQPYGTDYIAWFQAIGHLSRKFANLKGIVMDDFNYNTDFFSPYYLKKMRTAAKRENANLKFHAQLYYPNITKSFLHEYKELIDGVILAYRDDPHRNTHRVHDFLHQIDEKSSLLRSHNLPLIIMIYASHLSRTPTSPTLSYIEGTIKAALLRLKMRQIQGVITYVLYKEPSIESREDKAARGNGYANLFSPNNTLPKGGYAEIQQQIYVHPRGPQRLTFSQFSFQSFYLGQTSYQAEILIDHHIVWRKKLDSKNNNKWQLHTINLTPYLNKKTNAILSLRLTKCKSGSATWAYNGFDNLIPTGFSLSDPQFETATHWNAVSNNRTMISSIILFDPQRRAKALSTITEHYTAFHIFNQIVSNLKDPYLLKEADYFLQCVLVDQSNEAKITVSKMLGAIQKNKEASPKIRELLVSSIYKYLNMPSTIKSKQ